MSVLALLALGCSVETSALSGGPGSTDSSTDSSSGVDSRVVPMDTAMPGDGGGVPDATPDARPDAADAVTPDATPDTGTMMDSAMPDTAVVDTAPPIPCRDRPSECVGLFGGYCDMGACTEGECCTDSNCGGSRGTCTQRCGGGSGPCPPDMDCQHGYCFYRCSVDSDCFGSMSCEHDNTICEW